MTNAEKLHALADWFDAKYPDDPQPEVQRDLRNIAVRLQALEAVAEAARQVTKAPRMYRSEDKALVAVLAAYDQTRVCEAARRVVGTAPPSGPLSTSARDSEFLHALAETPPPAPVAPPGPGGGTLSGADAEVGGASPSDPAPDPTPGTLRAAAATGGVPGPTDEPLIYWFPYDGWRCATCHHPRREHDESGCQRCHCRLSDDDLGAATGGVPDPALPRGAHEAVPRLCTDPACPDRRNGTGEHMHLAVRYHPGAATTAELFTVGPAPQPEVEP